MSKTAVIVASPRADHQQFWGYSMIEGLKKHGWEARMATFATAADLVVFWGVRQEQAIAMQKLSGEVCILERGYVGDRFQWTSMSLGGGLNGAGKFNGPFTDASRWNKYFADMLKPWKTLDRDAPIVIMGQVLTDMSLRGLKPAEMWRDAAEYCKRWGHRVCFRPHPQALTVRIPGIENCSAPSLQEALDMAKGVVTINSNSGVDAILSGTPTISLDPRSMVWDITRHDMGELLTPSRDAWAAAIAWKQWRPEEISSGVAWDTLNAGRL